MKTEHMIAKLAKLEEQVKRINSQVFRYTALRSEKLVVEQEENPAYADYVRDLEIQLGR